ncbi:hypothetical protein [Empedobacter sp. GD03865]|uniref:hypothetical protein n=1 Tax=Empedobacter sp. GD03865 TaxID=2975392 RepID=UPI002449A766|nr:hypothetical protein [Empedobacter sp. GD03865]MDH0658091.1 hypothetical protein [Empedobacter sp. GD03865]
MKNWRRFVVLIDIFIEKKEGLRVTILDLPKEDIMIINKIFLLHYLECDAETSSAGLNII